VFGRVYEAIFFGYIDLYADYGGVEMKPIRDLTLTLCKCDDELLLMLEIIVNKKSEDNIYDLLYRVTAAGQTYDEIQEHGKELFDSILGG
jgi:hypothetical protein